MGNPNINVLCIAGAMVGLTCLLTSWAVVSEIPPGWPFSSHMKTLDIASGSESWTLFDALAATYDPSSYAYGNIEFVAFGALFIGGTILAFLTPLGGVAQFLGIIGFHQATTELLFVEEFTAGMLVAAVSAAIVLLSFVTPFGVGYDRGPVSLRSRLLTVSRS